jgi:hypothetical protein
MRAEALQFGREPAPFEEVVARQLIAERVLQRVVDLRRWSARRQRADRKALPGAERRLGLDARILDATANGAALNDIEMRRRAETRRQYPRSFAKYASLIRGMANANASSGIRSNGACLRRNSRVESIRRLGVSRNARAPRLFNGYSLPW